MCIAIIKPASAPLPTIEQLRNCAKTNKDGGGLCYPTKSGKIQIVKGFKDAEDMSEFLKKQDFSRVPMMFHFRIGTHGGKSDPRHTHPFPVGSSVEEMENILHLCDEAIMHNGILYKFGYEKEISDTMAFARDAMPSINSMPFPCKDLVIGEIIGSSNKIAVMDREGNIEKYGSWIEDGGLFWSNGSYKSYTAAADPRTWGTCGGYVYGGGSYSKSKKKSYDQSCFDDDWPSSRGDGFSTDFGGYEVPSGGQFWSELIEARPKTYDETALREEYMTLARSRSKTFPRGVYKPADVTHIQWDVVMSYRYAYGYISDDMWDVYTKVERVLPKELDLEESISQQIEDACKDQSSDPEQQEMQRTLPLEQQFVDAE